MKVGQTFTMALIILLFVFSVNLYFLFTIFEHAVELQEQVNHIKMETSITATTVDYFDIQKSEKSEFLDDSSFLLSYEGYSSLLQSTGAYEALFYNLEKLADYQEALLNQQKEILTKISYRPIIEGIHPLNSISYSFLTTMDQFLQQTIPTPQMLPWETWTTNVTIFELVDTSEEMKKGATQFMPGPDITRQILESSCITQEEFDRIYPSVQGESGFSFIIDIDSTKDKFLSPLLQTIGLLPRYYEFSFLFHAQHVNALPLPLKIWCYAVAGASTPSDCLLSALARNGSPLGRTTFISHNSITEYIEKYNISKNHWNMASKNIIFDDELFPVQIGLDATRFFVAFLQQLSEMDQKKVAHFIPRSYLIHSPCRVSGRLLHNELDQWNLWLYDFFNGNPPEYLPRLTEEKWTHIGNASLSWTKKQLPIDGDNLWISKPASSLADDKKYNDKWKQRGPIIPDNNGDMTAVSMLHHPSDFNDVVRSDNELFGSCISSFRLVMKYIENPLLVGGKKSDIRLYVLVTSLDPLEAYFHKEIISIRTATSKYDASSKDPRIHLSNLGGGDNSDYFSRYVNKIVEEYNLPSSSDLEEELFDKFRSVVATTLNSLPIMDQFFTSSTSLMEWNFILDKNLNPWLFDINRVANIKDTLVTAASYPDLLYSALELAFLKHVSTKNSSNMPDSFLGWQRISP